MPTVHFLGKVLPSTHYSPTMWGLPKVNYKSAETGLIVDLTINIKGSSVDVECVTDQWDSNTIGQVHKIAYDLARSAINLISFATGITLSVVFDQFVDVEGVLSPFAIQSPDLGALCTSYGLVSAENQYGLGDIMKIVFAEPSLFLALDDLITATSLHHLITINSARAIEALRHAMASAGMSRHQAWLMFRENLNLREEYLKLITEHSKSGRHGEGVHVPGPITTEIIRRSWIIMNRFLEFRKGGNQPLDKTTFPVLEK